VRDFGSMLAERLSGAQDMFRHVFDAPRILLAKVEWCSSCGSVVAARRNQGVDERVDVRFGGSGSSLETRWRGKCQHFLPTQIESFGKHSSYARACVISNLVHLSSSESATSEDRFTQDS
jgi:hypothetical protein